MTVPNSLPQRIFLLAYNPAKGRVRVGTNLGAMLRSAALADLYLNGHLADERGHAAIEVRHPRHDPVLEALLEEIAGSKPRKWQFWVDRRQRAAVSAVRQQLSDGGWVRLEPHRILGLFPTTKVTIRDPRVRKELLGRVNAALKKPIGRIDPADAALAQDCRSSSAALALGRGPYAAAVQQSRNGRDGWWWFDRSRCPPRYVSEAGTRRARARTLGRGRSGGGHASAGSVPVSQRPVAEDDRHVAS